MEDLHVTQGARQKADSGTAGSMPARRRHAPIAVPGLTRIGRQADNRAHTGFGERHKPTSDRQTRHTARNDPAPGRPSSPISVIIGAGLAGEVVLPWAVIWISDLLVVDVPAWSLWLVFGVPPALAFVAAAARLAARTFSRQPIPTAILARQGSP